LAEQPVTIRVRRGEGDKAQPVDVAVPPQFRLTLGVRMQMGSITSLREHSPATRAKVQVPDPANSHEGDLIEKVEVLRADGDQVVKVFNEKTLDPEKLPYELKRLARELDGKMRVALQL